MGNPLDIVIWGVEGEQYNTYNPANPGEPPYRLGTKMVMEDGRIFRFARMGAVAGVAGKLYQSSVPVSAHAGLSVAAAVAVNSRTIPFTDGSTAITADQYGEGYVNVEDVGGAGYGHTYKISEHHDANAGSVNSNMALKAGNAVQVALNTSDKITLLKHPHADIIIHPSPPTAMVVGVPNIAVPAGDYCWIQTGGVCSVLTQGTVVIAQWCMPSQSADGAVTPWILTEGTPNTIINGPVGWVYAVSATTDYSSIFLTLES